VHCVSRPQEHQPRAWGALVDLERDYTGNGPGSYGFPGASAGSLSAALAAGHWSPADRARASMPGLSVTWGGARAPALVTMAARVVGRLGPRHDQGGPPPGRGAGLVTSAPSELEGLPRRPCAAPLFLLFLSFLFILFPSQEVIFSFAPGRKNVAALRGATVHTITSALGEPCNDHDPAVFSLFHRIIDFWPGTPPGAKLFHARGSRLPVYPRYVVRRNRSEQMGFSVSLWTATPPVSLKGPVIHPVAISSRPRPAEKGIGASCRHVLDLAIPRTTGPPFG